MKKIFTLFAAALMGLAAFADPSPAQLNLVAEGEQDASEVKIEIELINNATAELGVNSVQAQFTASEGVEFVEDFMGDIFTNEAYLDYIMSNFPNYANLSDANKQKAVAATIDLMQINKEGKPIVIQTLKNKNCRDYPLGTGKILAFSVDLSKVADGDYTISTIDGTEATVIAFTDAHAEQPEVATITLQKKGDKVTQVKDGIDVVDAVKNVTGVKYYNLQGVESATPFQGVNIMVKTYEDGSKQTVKVVK